MTSTEKIARLKRAIAAAIAESKGDPQLAVLLGAWAFLPGFMRRRLLESLPLPALDDEAALDELLGLIAGVALELVSDDLIVPVGSMRESARELLEQLATPGVGPAAAHEAG